MNGSSPGPPTELYPGQLNDGTPYVAGPPPRFLSANAVCERADALDTSRHEMREASKLWITYSTAIVCRKAIGESCGMISKRCAASATTHADEFRCYSKRIDRSISSNVGRSLAK